MYAVVLDRCHQFRAEPGVRLRIDRRSEDVGATLALPILFYADGQDVRFGDPLVADRQALCRVVAHSRGRKGIAGTFKRRKHERRRVGFRRDITVVEVVSIG